MEVYQPCFDVKIMLLAAETGSVSSGNRLSSFTFDDTQLLIFGFH